MEFGPKQWEFGPKQWEFGPKTREFGPKTREFGPKTGKLGYSGATVGVQWGHSGVQQCYSGDTDPDPYHGAHYGSTHCSIPHTRVPHHTHHWSLYRTRCPGVLSSGPPGFFRIQWSVKTTTFTTFSDTF